MAAQKKVIVRRFKGPPLWGYLEASGFVRGDRLELLQVDGRSCALPLVEVKYIAFVRDFNVDDPESPERLGRPAFGGRPRAEGLWLALTLVDDSAFEVLSPFDCHALDGMIEERGLMGSPPEARSNTLRLFVPRSSLRTVELLGAVLAPSAKAAAKAPRRVDAADSRQGGLFGEQG